MVKEERRAAQPWAGPVRAAEDGNKLSEG